MKSMYCTVSALVWFKCIQVRLTKYNLPFHSDKDGATSNRWHLVFSSKEERVEAELIFVVKVTKRL